MITLWRNIKRFLFCFGWHEWEVVYSGYGIEIRECKYCECHLNMNHSLQQAFMTSSHGLKENMERTDELVEQYMKRRRELEAD